MNCLSMLLSLGLACFQMSQSDLLPVYDGRSLSVAPPARAKLEAYEGIFQRDILPAARHHWADKIGRCDQHANNFLIIDVARGSFTQPGANQVSILYKYCETAHNFALDGLAITDDDRVVAHIVYEGAWNAAAAALPDINGNGLSEIAIDTRGMNMGEGWATISIIEFSKNSITKFGSTETESYSCGAVGNQHSRAYVIYVKPGATPIFYHVSYEQACSLPAPWKKSGGLQRISLEESDTRYQRIQ
jgi:hypothetical protein